jgi:hypothetical protein
MTDNIVIIDTVSDAEWDGKLYKEIVTMQGETFKLGRHLTEKYDVLGHGVALRLIMDTYKDKPYVKDFDTCQDLSEKRKTELCQPLPKNPKDASIEKQVAVKCVAELMAAGIELPEDITKATIEWLRSALK